MKAYDLIIDNVTVLAMDANDARIDDGVIGIENGAISLLGKRVPSICYLADERIDAQGMVALPGFVNTHVAR